MAPLQSFGRPAARDGELSPPHPAKRPPCRGATPLVPDGVSAAALRTPISVWPGGICCRRTIPRPFRCDVQGGSAALRLWARGFCLRRTIPRPSSRAAPAAQHPMASPPACPIATGPGSVIGGICNRSRTIPCTPWPPRVHGGICRKCRTIPGLPKLPPPGLAAVPGGQRSPRTVSAPGAKPRQAGGICRSRTIPSLHAAASPTTKRGRSAEDEVEQ